MLLIEQIIQQLIGVEEYKKILILNDYLNSNIEVMQKVCSIARIEYFKTRDSLAKDYDVLFVDLEPQEQDELLKHEAILLKNKKNENITLLISNIRTKVQDVKLTFTKIAFTNKSVIEPFLSVKKVANVKFFTQDEAVELMNQTLSDAVSSGVSDIYIRPNKIGYIISFRFHDKVERYKEIDLELGKTLINVIGIRAKMKIESDEPILDGNMMLSLNHAQKEFRVNAIKSAHKQLRDVTIRVAGFFNPYTKMEDLGFSNQILILLREVYHRQKLIIFSAPTGHGKTTALMTILLELVNRHAKVVKTIEDPIEYDLSDYFSNLQINENGSENYFLDYDKGIKSLMRGKPDVILIGEVRDEKSAKGAMSAAMTGHTVFTTLHASKAKSAFSRLKNFNISESDMVENIGAIICMRLEKKLCQECKTFNKETGYYERKIEDKDGEVCLLCKNSGYKNKIILNDVVIMNNNIDSYRDKNAFEANVSYYDTAKYHLESGNISYEDYLTIEKKLKADGL